MERVTNWSDDYRQRFEIPQNWRKWVKWLIPVIIAIWLLSGIYIVGPDEQGVVRRFGKMVRTAGPGPHYHLPIPIEEVDTPKVQQVRRIEVGFRTISSGTPARYRFYEEESLMLTGDEQIVDAQVTVQYKIKNAANYLFNVKHLEGQYGTIKDSAEVALRQVVGQRPIDDVLVGKKLEVESGIRKVLQTIIDGYKSGIRIVEVKLQTVQPPKEVASAFSDVVSAKEDKERAIQDANGYMQDVKPKARGKARRIELAAEAYKTEKVKRAQGDAEKFAAVLKEYTKAKSITRKRLYLETMEQVLPGIKKFIIDPDASEGPVQLLPLDTIGGQK